MPTSYRESLCNTTDTDENMQVLEAGLDAIENEVDLSLACERKQEAVEDERRRACDRWSEAIAATMGQTRITNENIDDFIRTDFLYGFAEEEIDKILGPSVRWITFTKLPSMCVNADRIAARIGSEMCRRILEGQKITQFYIMIREERSVRFGKKTTEPFEDTPSVNAHVS